MTDAPSVDLLRRVLYLQAGEIDESRLHQAMDKASEYEGTRFLYETCGFYLAPQREITMQENERLIDDLYSTPKFNEGINTCSKCGGNITTSVAKQTRSADEGTTFFITCHGCHHHWTVAG